MTLVNDDRRDITIVFNAPEDFTLNGDELKATSKMHHCYVKGCGFVDIQRVVKQSPHSKSYILNTSNYPVFMNYYIKSETGDEISVGPTADAILPGQFKEIGAGPGVVWRISTI